MPLSELLRHNLGMMDLASAMRPVSTDYQHQPLVSQNLDASYAMPLVQTQGRPQVNWQGLNDILSSINLDLFDDDDEDEEIFGWGQAPNSKGSEDVNALQT